MKWNDEILKFFKSKVTNRCAMDIYNRYREYKMALAEEAIFDMNDVIDLNILFENYDIPVIMSKYQEFKNGYCITGSNFNDELKPCNPLEVVKSLWGDIEESIENCPDFYDKYFNHKEYSEWKEFSDWKENQDIKNIKFKINIALESIKNIANSSKNIESLNKLSNNLDIIQLADLKDNLEKTF